MRTPIPDYLDEILDALRDDDSGSVADYIPALKAANPDLFAVALTTVAGRTYSSGDCDVEFSIQSMSKPFAYAAALADRGEPFVTSRVGVDPSGEAFNELSLETGSHRPRNPMINAGAITTHHLLVGSGTSRQIRVERAREFFSELAGRPLRIDERIVESELEAADRNLAIAHMLRNYGIIEDDPHEVVAGYTAQCSISVTVRDIAMMTATLANGGIHPVTGTTVVARPIARRTLSVMASAGMYDAAGSWFTDVGIPAKSGVAGGLLGALPGQVGIGTLSPRLDDHGNSVRGQRVFRRLSADMGLHLMDSEALGSREPRSIAVSGDTTTVALQGVIDFTGAEVVLDRLDRSTPTTPKVIIDLSRVDSFTDVGRRMVLEGMRRLSLDGLAVGLKDPDEVLPEPDLGDGTFPFIPND
ncbi:L-glutaminase [Brevibacterium siliguriense]|uniref:Glutaminase n=1 Tax=Brevibacterium siliguriense TaxID=1136497 RepID=A0A1H1LU93_9MICO|nr:glutaminase [Brevibacterium siliguriense]SDR78096.1 L-glutaminase [Brevibacterium siliguriense]